MAYTQLEIELARQLLLKQGHSEEQAERSLDPRWVRGDLEAQATRNRMLDQARNTLQLVKAAEQAVDQANPLAKQMREHAASSSQKMSFRDLQFQYDGLMLTVQQLDRHEYPVEEMSFMWGQLAELYDALIQPEVAHYLGLKEIAPGQDGSVEIVHSDYDMEERPIGAQIKLLQQDLPSVCAWLLRLHLPPDPLTGQPRQRLGELLIAEA